MTKDAGVPNLITRQRTGSQPKRFPREIEYGDAHSTGQDDNCVFIVDLDEVFSTVTLEDCRTGEIYTMTAEEAAVLGTALVRGAKKLQNG